MWKCIIISTQFIKKKSIEMKEKQIVYCSASIESLFVIIFIIKMYFIIFNIIVLISTLILLLHLF